MSLWVRNTYNNVSRRKVKFTFWLSTHDRLIVQTSRRNLSFFHPKCDAASEPLAAAVLLREALLPGAAGQREQQEEDSSHDEDGARTAHAGHRPGELVVQGHRVVAGQ